MEKEENVAKDETWHDLAKEQQTDCENDRLQL